MHPIMSSNSGNAESLENKISHMLDNLPYANDELKVPLFIDALPDVAACIYLSSINENLKKVGDRAVQQLCSVIFNSKTKLYEAFLTSLDDADISEEYSSNVMRFFKELQNLIWKQDSVYGKISGNKAGSELMRKIMCEVLNQNRSNLEPLKILALLCAISGLDIPLLMTADSCCNSIFKTGQNDVNLIALHGLLEACSLYPQYFNVTSAPQEHLKPSDWLEGMMASLFDMNGIKDRRTWLKCFRSLLKISVPVIENNINNIIKTCLFKVNMDADSKDEYCGLFIDLLSVYSRLHQLPKFFVKLLHSLAECTKENTAGVCLVKGQIFPTVLFSVATHTEDLHFKQTIELWERFSETYSLFGSMSEVFVVAKGVVFIVAQIFSTFLLHSKILDPSLPSGVNEKYSDLIQLTINELKNNLTVLADAKKVVLQRAFLLLCNAVGKVQLTHSYHDENSSVDNWIWKSPDNPFDFSLMFDFFTEKHAKILESHLNGEDQVLGLLVFQLLILKIEKMMHKKELSEIELTQMKITISTVVQHAEENVNNVSSWDLDLNTLSMDNYGTAIWRSLLEFLPLILNTMDSKELLKICAGFREIILHRDVFHSSDCLVTTDLASIVLLSLQSPHFQQSKCFQRTLISSMWKLDSLLLARKRLSIEMDTEGTFIKVLTDLGSFRRKWMKYDESTPKDGESSELNPLWSGMKETCAYLNDILQSKSIVRTKVKAKIYNILQLIDCIPLRYLLPGNQVRCVVGLSALFFLIPESFHSDKAIKIAEKIAKQLISIFDGERSVWLFDFVTSGPYLREVMNTIEKLTKDEHCAEIPDSLKLLLEHFINLITKNSKILSEAEDYFSELVKEENFSPVSILVLNLTLKKLAQVNRKKDSNPDYVAACEQLSSSVCSCCVKALKKCDATCNDSTYSALIKCYTEVVEILTLPTCAIDEKRRDKYLSQLPKIIEFSKQRYLMNNSENSLNSVILQFFARICKHNQHITGFVPERFHSDIWASIDASFQQRCSNATNIVDGSPCTQIKDDEVELLQCLFPLLSSEELNDVFDDLSNQMKNWNVAEGNVYTLQMNLNIIKEILNCDSQKNERDLPRQSVINLLLNISYHVSQADDSTLHVNAIKIPVFHFLNFLLKQRKSGISHDQWLDCLYPFVTVNLTKLSHDLPVFVNMFDAVWNCVYNLLIHHPEFILKTISVFMMIVTNLLKSLVLAGSQDAVHGSSKDIQDKMLLCSQNMDRLLTAITRHGTQFAKLVPFLIGDYADSIQHVTLEASIKSNLVSGLNRLLSLCSEHSLKMVSVNISHSCREIFTNIVKDYNQSRYRGYV